MAVIVLAGILTSNAAVQIEDFDKTSSTLSKTNSAPNKR